MRSRRAALVLIFALLSGGAIGACGGGGALEDSVPKSTPDLTVPQGSSAVAPAQTTSTTSTTSTTTTPTTTSSTGGVTPSTQSTTTPSTSGGTPAGGTSTPTTTPSNSGGTPADGFSDFCKQNPGACGQ